MTTFADPFDDRTDDDMPPAASTVTQITLGSRWKVEAADDGTVVFTDRQTRQVIEVGAESAAQWMSLFVECGLAAQAWLELDRYASKPRVGPDWFALMAGAQRDARRIA